MARAKKTEEMKQKDAIVAMQRSVDAATKENEMVQRQLADQRNMLEATFRQVEASPDVGDREAIREAKKKTKALETQQKKMTSSHRIAVDLGGGMIAQVSTETINALWRAAADWMPGSWVAPNVDYLQGAPHLILGLGVYVAELATRKKGEMPSGRREVISEASKLFSQLGFSNIVRALRVRYLDGKQMSLDMKAILKEKAALEQRVAALQAAAAKK